MPIQTEEQSKHTARPKPNIAPVAVGLALLVVVPIILVRLKPLQVQLGDWRLEVGAYATAPFSWSSPASFDVAIKDCNPEAHVADLRIGEAAWYAAYGRWRR